MNNNNTRKEFLIAWLKKEGVVTNHHWNDNFSKWCDKFYKSEVKKAKSGLWYYMNKLRIDGYCGKATTYGLGFGSYSIHGAKKETLWLANEQLIGVREGILIR